MANPYGKHAAGVKVTPQAKKAKKGQKKNSAGGFVFKLDKFDHLRRFLILGTEGGTYYANEQKHTKQAFKCVDKCVKEDGLKTVGIVAEISDAGRAPKNDPAIYAIAACLASKDPEVVAAAVQAVPKVCRIGTHMYHFLDSAKALLGLTGKRGGIAGRALRSWMDSKDVSSLAYQFAKYQSRDGWSSRDLLRVAHPKPKSAEHDALFSWACGKGLKESYDDLKIIEGLEKAKAAPNQKEVLKLIETYNLSREMIPTEYQNKPEVQEAMLPKMPITALIRNLGNLSKSELLTEGKFDIIETVVNKITDENLLKKGRVHPIQVLSALMTYSAGQGFRGKGTWKPVKDVMDALDKAFYLAFGAVEPANARTYIGLDVSGSMGSPIGGLPFLDCRTGSAAMAMVTYKTEPKTILKGFTGGGWYRDSDQNHKNLTDIDISRRSSLNSVVNAISRLDFGGTDCSLPMIDAIARGLEIDQFIVYTDNETWAGRKHPFQALKEYRQESGIDAKLVVVGMTGTKFTIADPSDPGMLDVVGFDTAAPNIISAFARGDF
jgi:60 kDa SS-A/Ro ribonucleoprotein